jgi:hypothetical protein
MPTADSMRNEPHQAAGKQCFLAQKTPFSGPENAVFPLVNRF